MSKILIEEMTQEMMDDLMLDANLNAMTLGFKNYEEMEDFKVNASLGMIKFGGSFAHMLGHVLAHADSNNTRKIILTWREECELHAELYLKFMSKQEKS